MQETESLTITSRRTIAPVLDTFLNLASAEHSTIPTRAWQMLDQEVLRHRVKFPILEYVAVTLAGKLSNSQVTDLMDRAANARHISSYPLIGKLIQLKLNEDLMSAFGTAIDHIIQGDEWYACDIISERVFGEALLWNFDDAYNQLEIMGQHQNLWIQRSIGIATHYATKKKLQKDQVEALLLLMLRHGFKTQLYIKKGIGWPAKTIAKFHPDLIYKHQDLILQTKLSAWFKNKINIGLSMAKQSPLTYE